MKFTSSLIAAGSGSLGGSTFSHNRGGPYIRNRSVPVNTMTARRTAVRGAFAGLSNQWRNLSAEDQEGWSTYAEATPVMDSLGFSRTLSGQQMYIRCNTPRVQVDDTALTLARVDTPPTVPGFGVATTKITEALIAIGGATMTISGEFGTEADSAGTVIIYVGLPMSTGATYYGGPFQLVGLGAFAMEPTTWINAAIPMDPLGLSNRFLAEDDRVAIRTRTSMADGRLSQPFTQIVTVTQEEV